MYERGIQPVLLRITALLLLGIAVPSFAQDILAKSVNGSIGATGDYVFRGLSQTDGRPALQADIHYASPLGWSVGLWGSTVDRNSWDGRTVELDVYLGYRWTISQDWTAKIAAVDYRYPWNKPIIRYDYDELIGTLGFRNKLFFTMAWTPNTSRYSTRGYVTGKEAISYEGAATLPVVGALVANLGIGYYDLQSVIDTGYLYWNAGVGYDWRAWHVDLGYFGTGSNAKTLFLGNVADNRWAAGISWRF